MVSHEWVGKQNILWNSIWDTKNNNGNILIRKVLISSESLHKYNYVTYWKLIVYFVVINEPVKVCSSVTCAWLFANMYLCTKRATCNLHAYVYHRVQLTIFNSYMCYGRNVCMYLSSIICKQNLHSVARVTIERCIGPLKGRIRNLLHCLPMTVLVVVEYIVGCYVIHKICTVRCDEVGIMTVNQESEMQQLSTTN